MFELFYRVKLKPQHFPYTFKNSKLRGNTRPSGYLFYAGNDSDHW